MIEQDIPIWEKEYGGEQFLEYFTWGVSGTLYLGLFHLQETIPHIPLIPIGGA